MRPHELLKLHPDNLTPKQLAEIKAFLGACNGCNAHAHRRGATREALGPYLAIMEAIAALHLLQGKPAPDMQRNRQDEMEPPEMDAADTMGQQTAGAARSHDRPPKRARRTIVRFKAGPATPTR